MLVTCTGNLSFVPAKQAAAKPTTAVRTAVVGHAADARCVFSVIVDTVHLSQSTLADVGLPAKLDDRPIQNHPRSCASSIAWLASDRIPSALKSQ